MAQTAPPRKLDAKGLLVQTAFLALAVVVVAGAISSARTNLDEMGLSSGFAFLDRATGWSYSFSLIERSIDDSYRWTLFIGFLNTLFLGAVSILLATLLGFAVGTARDARNLAIRSSAAIFIQLFRNVPLILQLVFWYAVMIHLPGPRQAMSVLDLAFLSNRGMMIPGLNIPPLAALGLLVFAVLAAVVLARSRAGNAGKKVLTWIALVAAASAAAAVTLAPEGEGLISYPALKGLRFVGGVELSVELAAMIVAITLYGAAYIAEVVQGGLKEVPRGLVEAGDALGLPRHVIWLKIKMPMALRTIIPPLGNQWVFLMKATTIGVAIGFSDLFMIVSTSITQSGQTLELIGILMATFLLINFSLAQLVNLINGRLRLKGH
ncbi:MAG: ABC transporter permease subunit [Kiloniellales bacterium]|nr:ABC transporter permease subunit [Kiloniellales bacterium]